MVLYETRRYTEFRKGKLKMLAKSQVVCGVVGGNGKGYSPCIGKGKGVSGRIGGATKRSRAHPGRDLNVVHDRENPTDDEQPGGSL